MRKPIQYFYEVKGTIDEVESGAGRDGPYVSGGSGYIKSILHCFCDDGTVWFLKDNDGTDVWAEWDLPAIPQE